MRVGREAWEAIEPTGDPATLRDMTVPARQRRSTLTHKFCMLLWSRTFDRDMYEDYRKDAATIGDPARPAEQILIDKAKHFRQRIAKLTMHLDRAGYFALMLFPEGQNDPPPEPLVLKAPAQPPGAREPSPVDMWFYLFTGFVQLAQAIVVEANYGRGLAQEFEHIATLALSPRVLLFDVDETLYRIDDDRRWPLASIGDAVTFAAAQDPQAAG
jgi:hypothetical protein